jgi:hypothetical protein
MRGDSLRIGIIVCTVWKSDTMEVKPRDHTRVSSLSTATRGLGAFKFGQLTRNNWGATQQTHRGKPHCHKE